MATIKKKKPAIKKQFSISNSKKKQLLDMHPSDMRASELNLLTHYIREDQTFSKAWRAATPKLATKKKPIKKAK